MIQCIYDFTMKKIFEKSSYMLKFTRNTVLDEFKVNGVNTLRPSPEVVLVYLLSTLDTLKTTIYNYSLLTLTMFFIV